MRRLRDRVETFRYRSTRRLRLVAMALSGGVTELFGSGSPTITMTSSAAVTAGRVVEITGNRTVGQAGAGSLKCLGVAKQTSSASGDKLAIATGGVWMLVAAGAINAGDHVEAAANGTVRVLATIDVTGSLSPKAVVGIALAAISDTASGPILLKIG